jgi:hypothetical protein
MPTKKPVTKKSVKTIAKKATVKKKPVAKKTTVKKKVTAKKTTTKKANKTPKATAMKKPVKDLVFASDQESFWVQNGEVLNSLMALNDAFANMDKDIYQFHAHGDRNDFSIWVDTVLSDAACAADLKKAKTQKSARTIVVKHLKLYSI